MYIPSGKSFFKYTNLYDLTFDLLWIQLQNVTLVNCMCSGGICVSQTHLVIQPGTLDG